ncbi:hypothetical protein LSTR_LSTR014688 [Laodelphax striatellus]|uniref:BTB domain-containing protein n=1 Tax=Laodelphax striatellus TaxID=195883 RepID=A0A482X181_LAOST|nr:hypothetical protein LSTR_LSTR014688 [Laodelphax striatellus]
MGGERVWWGECYVEGSLRVVVSRVIAAVSSTVAGVAEAAEGGADDIMHAFATGGSSGSGSGGSGGGGSSASSSTTGGGGAGSPQLFCLRWNNYQSNLTNVFDQLLQSESFVDVTLACDGHSVKAHKVVLSACSPYFQALFFDNPCRHPIVILKDVRWPELKAAVEFMYKGEINVSQEQIGPLLQVAESLKIRGLADVSGAGDSDDSKADTVSLAPRPAKKRRRDSSPAADSPSASNGLPDALGLVTTSPPAPSSMCPPPPPPPQQQPPPANAASNQMSLAALPPPPPPPQSSASAAAADDMEIKPGIAEMIREEERISTEILTETVVQDYRVGVLYTLSLIELYLLNSE